MKCSFLIAISESAETQKHINWWDYTKGKKNEDALPRYVTLTDTEGTEVIEKLLLRAGCPSGTPLEIIQMLFEQSKSIEGLKLKEVNAPLEELFYKAGIVAGLSLYVEWGSLCDIDRFQTDDLKDHFYDVWYPSSDDIEIFDETLSWIMFVRHYGRVEIWRQAFPKK